MARPLNPNSFPTIAAVVVLASITPAVLLFAPVIVGALVTDLGFTLQQAGYIISIELAGMAFATIPALFWLSKLNWQKVCYVALAFIITANLASAQITSFEYLAFVRFMLALAGGSIMLIGLATIGLAENQERLFGLWVVGQLLVGTIGLATLPHVVTLGGVGAFYAGLAVLMVPLLLLVRHLPSHGARDIGAQAKISTTVLKLGTLGLAAIFLFYVSLGGVWAYVERIGAAAGFASSSIGYTLSIASIVGIAGATTASAMGARFGRLIPIVAGFMLLLASIFLLFSLHEELTFLLASCFFKYAWTFTLPYLLASMTSLDKSGHLIVTTNLVIGGGLAAGPALAALTLTENVDFNRVLLLGIGCGITSGLLMLPLALSKPELA